MKTHNYLNLDLLSPNIKKIEFNTSYVRGDLDNLENIIFEIKFHCLVSLDI